MELRQLEAFVHVVELGSFSRAATILDSNQPTLSRLVRQLETELRQTLLHRNGRGVTATAAGQVMLAHAKGMLLQTDRVRNDLQNLRGAEAGHVNLGLAPSFSKLMTRELVRRFRERFPGSTISVAEGLSTHLTEWLMMGRIDIAVMYETVNGGQLIETRTAYEEELFVTGLAEVPGSIPVTGRGAAARAVPIAKIGEVPLVIPSRLHAIRQVVEAQATQIGAKLQIALEVDAIPSVLDFVSDGYGYAVVPFNAVLSDSLQRRFTVTAIQDTPLISRLVLATSTQHTLSRLAAKAVALIENELVPMYRAERKTLFKEISA